MTKGSVRKLKSLVQSRFDMLYAESNGSAHPERLLEIVRDWHVHICSLGMHLSGSVGDQGIYIPDPGRNFWLGQDEYICVSDDLAVKMLALGAMP